MMQKEKKPREQHIKYPACSYFIIYNKIILFIILLLSN
jgi:hypothetical protein